jgi:hypothetical protein
VNIFRFPARFHVVAHRVPSPGDLLVARYESHDETLLIVTVQKYENTVTVDFLNQQGVLKQTWFSSYTLFLGQEDRT